MSSAILLMSQGFLSLKNSRRVHYRRIYLKENISGIVKIYARMDYVLMNPPSPPPPPPLSTCSRHFTHSLLHTHTHTHTSISTHQYVERRLPLWQGTSYRVRHVSLNSALLSLCLSVFSPARVAVRGLPWCVKVQTCAVAGQAGRGRSVRPAPTAGIPAATVMWRSYSW